MTGLAGKLEPIDEDETDVLVKLVQDSRLGLSDSKFAHKHCRPVAEHRPGNSSSYKQHTPDRTETPPSFAPKMKKDIGIEDPGKDYMDQVVSGLKKKQQPQQHIQDIKNENGVLTGELHRVGQSPELSKATYDAATPVKYLEKVSLDMKTEDREFSVTAAAEESSSIQAQEAGLGTDDPEIVENRECLTQFKSWGKPEVRDKPGKSMIWRRA
jgi:hypothetical protein